MSNPFSSFPTEKQDDIHGLVDQAVVLNTALVPKLPEINVVDGMVPIIDQVYCDSGSTASFQPNTTINFNFGNAAGKLIDWTQSRLCFNVNVGVTATDLKNTKMEDCHLGSKNVRCALRHGAMVFSQVTLGGAGRPLTINDFEMCALAKHLLTTCESNVNSRIGEITCHNFPGCSVALSNFLKTELPGSQNNLTKNYVIPVSIPVTSVIPQMQGVENYLNSVTTGIELRLTVSNNPGIFSFIATQSIDQTNPRGAFSLQTQKRVTNTFFYNHFRENGVQFEGGMEETEDYISPGHAKVTHKVEAKLVSISDVRIDMISTTHPDDTITQMLTNIAMSRGLYYPHQMCVCTPFNFTLPQGGGHFSVLVPVVSGYNNIDTMFVWFTTRGDYTKFRKLPIKNLYTSLNGTYKTPIHQYRDSITTPMVECGHQFNRAFGTCSSTILSPLHEIMNAYMPQKATEDLFYTYPAASEWIQGELKDPQKKAQYLLKCQEIEYNNSDSFIANSCVWELEKTAWMSGPDFANYANKYQIVFDIDAISMTPAEITAKKNEREFTLWVCQRVDCYTHIRNGYLSLLTSKREVAMSLQNAI